MFYSSILPADLCLEPLRDRMHQLAGYIIELIDQDSFCMELVAFLAYFIMFEYINILSYVQEGRFRNFQKHFSRFSSFRVKPQ